jgi:hypothetical protein
MKSLLSAFLIALMVGGLALVGTVHFGTVQASTNVIGIINSDTTWTKANSPYTLTGSVAVNRGVTLTIEAGATVNLGDYYLQVNGTLGARGSGNEKIHFNGGQITFTQVSKSWNERTGSGCIIDNAILNLTWIFINNASPKINNASNLGISIDGGSPIISNNNITGGIQDDGVGGSPIISNNTITYTNGTSVIAIGESSPIISNNNITGTGNSRVIGIGGGSSVISNNTITGGTEAAIFVGGGSPIISNNTITGGSIGISLYGFTHFPYAISGNIISSCTVAGIKAAGCWATVERNLIINNPNGDGILIGTFSAFGKSAGTDLTIQNNTIANNYVGINLISPASTPVYTSTIVYNNIQNNSNYSIYSNSGHNVNATNNWWGTIDIPTINQTIFDNKNDFNLGTVNFIPFLTEPNPQAPPIPTPTSSPEPSSTQTTPQAELYEIAIAIIIILIVIVALLIVIIGLVLRKKR